MNCICKKTLYDTSLKWGVQYYFNMNAERTGKGLTIRMEVFHKMGYRKSSMTADCFSEHFVPLQKSVLKKFILEWRFLQPREKIPLLELFGFKGEAQWLQAKITSATILKNEKPPNVEEKPEPAPNPGMPVVTVPDARLRIRWASPKSAGRTCIINDQLNPAVPILDPISRSALANAIGLPEDALATAVGKLPGDENNFF